MMYEPGTGCHLLQWRIETSRFLVAKFSVSGNDCRGGWCAVGKKDKVRFEGLRFRLANACVVSK